MSAPADRRPGIPEGKWWHPIAYLAGLFGAAALAWALFAGVLWLVYAYALVVGTIASSIVLVVFAAHLALKRNWQSKVVAVALFVAQLALVMWATTR